MQKTDLDYKVVSRMLSDKATFGTILQTIALVCYGPEIYQIDPLEIYVRLKEDFGAQLAEDNESKLNAIMLATSTDAFYDDPEAFRGICNTLAEGDPGIDMFDDLTVAEILWGLYEVELNHGEQELGGQVQRVIDAEIQQEQNDPEDGQKPLDYIFDYLNERRNSLERQLKELGVQSFNLPPIQGQPEAQAA